MTRQEEIDRLAEIEAQPRTSAEFKAKFRADMERRWMLEDAGIPDMMRIKVERMIAAVSKAVGGIG